MSYILKKQYYKWILLILILTLIILCILSTSIGAANISFHDVFKVLINIITRGTAYSVDDTTKTIIVNLRLPRILLATVIGAGLSIAGAVFQGIFKNPMADPYVIGVSSGAAFGASLSILIGIGGFTLLGLSPLQIMAFLGAIASIFIVYSISLNNGRLDVFRLLLAGIAISLLLTAIISFLMLFNSEKIHSIVFWTMGSVARARWDSVISSYIIIVPCVICITFFSRDLNALLMGDDYASQLGIDIQRLKKTLILLCTLITASAVASAGIIGFVGLIIPHMVRLVTGPDNRILLPTSAIIGAIFLLVSDIIARTAAAPIEIPIGIITSLFGAPFFIYLLIKKGRNGGL